MTVELKELYEDESMGNSMKSLAYESIRPQMLTTEIRYKKINSFVNVESEISYTHSVLLQSHTLVSRNPVVNLIKAVLITSRTTCKQILQSVS